MKTASFFAGVGGIDLGFEQAGFQTVWANEWDPYAAETYRENFKCPIIVKDIKKIDPTEVTDHQVLLAGFPCQPFSLAGNRKGFDDVRGNVFFDLMNVVDQKKPEIIFLENVKNLVGHDKGNTFRIILNELEKRKYFTKYQVLNASMYGNIPQNRERIYIVAFKDHDVAKRFHFPDAVPLTTSLKDVINFNKKVDSKYYYTESQCSFFKELKEKITKTNTIYQWRRIYVRENKSGVCPTLTANMGTGGHNVPLIKTKYGIRKLTPRECFNLQGFNNGYQLPNTLSNTRLYQQAGNSVVVSVIKQIALKINEQNITN